MLITPLRDIDGRYRISSGEIRTVDNVLRLRKNLNGMEE